ncbi:MAG TPA: glycosyltransferase family 2 protein, partial [Defluviitaleaceae bacterium]|nr:glycosyltransferase family 2 protein [Defluviitaleaceae bacterium]
MFSVVIPLYNKELSIGNTIQSVLDQTYQEFEIVVVNDGSTDNSLQIVEQINDPRIRIINKPNGGVSSARNRGIKEAKSEWIALLDGDDLWTPNYLIEMKNLINDFHNNKFFGCNFSTIENGNINERAANLPPNFRGEILDYF